MSAQPDRAHREPVAEDGISAIGLTGDALLEACPWPESLAKHRESGADPAVGRILIQGSK
jgi:hypothetical protein